MYRVCYQIIFEVNQFCSSLEEAKEARAKVQKINPGTEVKIYYGDEEIKE